MAYRRIDRIAIDGAVRTKEETLLELLPRRPPALYSDTDLREVARRIGNLEVFDRVEVTRAGAVMQIVVREKWTLTPEFDFATGTTLKDTYALLGVTEYNAFGRASSLSLNVHRQRRGYGFHTAYEEHVYRRRRWARAAEVSYGSNEYSFASGDLWYTTSGLVYLWTTSPPVVSDHLRYELGVSYVRERVSDAEGMVRPPNGHVALLSGMMTWDAWQWHDLAPRGWSASLTFSPGVFVGPSETQPRHRVDVLVRAALSFSNRTVLMARMAAGATVRGNPNNSLFIGSVKGVRGLPDGTYLNWAQAYLNVELRQAVKLAERWALQGALFADSALFEQLDARGRRGAGHRAFSGGAGVRLVPTWLAGLVLRFDLARLVTPDRALFHQIGVSQYF